MGTRPIDERAGPGCSIRHVESERAAARNDAAARRPGSRIAHVGITKELDRRDLDDGFETVAAPERDGLGVEAQKHRRLDPARVALELRYFGEEPERIPGAGR